MKNLDKILDNKALIIGGIAVLSAVAYFGIARPLFQKFGLIDDKFDRQARRLYGKLSQSGHFSLSYYKNNESNITLNTINAQDIAKNIKNAWGIINDDESSIYANLEFIRTYADLSYVAYWYSQYAGKSLLDDLYEKMSSKEFLRIESIYNKMN